MRPCALVLRPDGGVSLSLQLLTLVGAPVVGQCHRRRWMGLRRTLRSNRYKRWDLERNEGAPRVDRWFQTPRRGGTRRGIGTADWRSDYNTNRPHSAHGDVTPTEFAKNGSPETNQCSHHEA